MGKRDFVTGLVTGLCVMGSVALAGLIIFLM